MGAPLVTAEKVMVEPALALAFMTASRSVQSVDAGVIQVTAVPRGTMSSLRLTTRVNASGFDIEPSNSAAPSSCGVGKYPVSPGSGSGFRPTLNGRPYQSGIIVLP